METIGRELIWTEGLGTMKRTMASAVGKRLAADGGPPVGAVVCAGGRR